jgi:Uma2 family endonuclease
MASSAHPLQQNAIAASPGRRLFTVDEYERLGEIGILTEDDRVELIEGEIIEKAAKGAAHVRCLMKCIRLFTQHTGGDLWLAIQDPVRLGGRLKPEPDLLVCRIADGAAAVVPDASNTLIVVEVSDSSLAYDRATKMPLYSRAGIPEGWLFDLVNRRVERYTDPGPEGYRLIAVAHRGESLASALLPGLTVVADELLS